MPSPHPAPLPPPYVDPVPADLFFVFSIGAILVLVVGFWWIALWVVPSARRVFARALGMVGRAQPPACPTTAPRTPNSAAASGTPEVRDTATGRPEGSRESVRAARFEDAPPPASGGPAGPPRPLREVADDLAAEYGVNEPPVLPDLAGEHIAEWEQELLERPRPTYLARVGREAPLGVGLHLTCKQAYERYDNGRVCHWCRIKLPEWAAS